MCFEQLDFYTWFLKECPNYQVGLRAFEKLKPYYVRRLKNWNICAYKYLVEMVELRHGFNNMQSTTKSIHG
jgi:hypothetical protein